MMDYVEAVSQFEEFFSSRYYDQVADAVQTSKEALEVEYEELDIFDPELPEYIRLNPASGIDAAQEGLENIDIISSEVPKVRIKGMPEEDFVDLENLRAAHIGKLIPVNGVVTDIKDSEPRVNSAIFECTQCGDEYLKEQDSTKLKSPYKCGCGSSKFEIQDKNHIDYQEFKIGLDSGIKCRCIGGPILDPNEFLNQEVDVVGICREEDNQIIIEINSVAKSKVNGGKEISSSLKEIVTESHDTSNIDSFLDDLSSDKFERVLADIFSKAGYVTETTSYTNDRGIDVRARKQFPIHQKFLIQAKCNAEDNNISADKVRNYHALKDQEEGVDQVILVTTSYLTSQAKEIASALDIKIINRDDLKKIISNYQEIKENGIIEVEKKANSEKLRSDETGDFDIDMIESGASSSQRNRIKIIKQVVESRYKQTEAFDLDEEPDISEMADIEEVIETAKEEGIGEEKAEDIIQYMKREGELFEPKQGYLHKI